MLLAARQPTASTVVRTLRRLVARGETAGRGARVAWLEAVAHGHLLALRSERGRRSRPKRRASATGTIFGPPHTGRLGLGVGDHLWDDWLCLGWAVAW